jgi:hypothetical protein
MSSFTYNDKVYNFAQEVDVHTNGKCVATLTDENNTTCELTFIDGKLVSITEIN